MRDADVAGAGQVRHGPGDFEDPRIGPGRHAEPFDGGFQQPVAFRIQPAVPIQFAGSHPGVGLDTGACETGLLRRPRGNHAATYRGRAVGRPTGGQLAVLDGGDVDLNVDAVQQRSRDAGPVALNLGRRAGAFVLGLAVVAARTGLRCLFAIRLKSLKPKEKAYPNDIRTLGDHLRGRRLDLGLLQRDVAAESGVSAATVKNWETNRAEPETRYLPAIIDFLGHCPYTTTPSFREWLRQCRTSLGLSQETLASELRIDESTIAGWERGDHRPTKSRLESLRGFFAGDF